MDAASLQQLETLCEKFYDGRDPDAQRDAEAVLLQFNQDPNCIAKCMQVLDQSQSPYANVLAASTITKIISKPSCSLVVQERLQIRNYALGYLGNRPDAPHYMVTELCKLVCKIVKLGWFDTDSNDNHVMRDVTEEIQKFLTSADINHRILGVMLLETLVTEMNQADNEQGLTKHRKVMNSFRDESLFNIFEVAREMTFKFVSQPAASENPALESKFAKQVLSLSCTCLSFDFLGTNTDESTDDTRTAQLPSNWRDTIVAENTMRAYFEIYMSRQAPVSSLAMTCLVQMASARRSMFQKEQRTEYLSRLILYVNRIFETQRGLDDPNNYHEFCRLLARLKTNFQLAELVNIDGYNTWVTYAAKFTVSSLQAWVWANNSLHYLLSLWDRMISSIPYVKSEKPHDLRLYSPMITEAYITSRVSGVEVILREGLEDPLDNIEDLEVQMKQISVIARCEFDKTCECLVSKFDPILNAYIQVLQQGPIDQSRRAQYQLLDGQLTWLMFIIGAVVGTRAQASPSESYDTYDAELICRALQLMKILDEHLARNQPASEQLNVAVLNFLQHFRVSFIGDTVPRHGKLYARLHEAIGIDDENRVLDVLIQKVTTNLRYWSSSDMIIRKTLKLLSDLCLGYSSLRRLVKSDLVQYILEHHTADDFPFLNTCPDTRHRTTFYNALGRIISSDTTENDGSRFENFLAPLTQVANAILEQLKGGMAIRDNQVVKATLRGFMRDLRGILQSLTSKPSFSFMFDWMYPDIMPCLIEGIKIWYDDPSVAIPILKCMCEFVTNKNSRLQMHTSSPNGILLFRETSKLLVAYGRRIVTVNQIDPTQLYPVKYKGITVCFQIFKASLLGDYVNFGVFNLYGDEALDCAFDVFFKLLVSVPLEDLLAYPKLCKSYYALMVALTRDHLRYIHDLDRMFFNFFCGSILQGIKSVDVQVCTQCCNSLDYLLSYIIVGLSKSKHDPVAYGLSDQIQANLDFLSQTLMYLLNLIMYEECKNQWSVSRPLLGLIILQPQIFQQAQHMILSQTANHKQEEVAVCFQNLMSGVEKTLSPKNRDKFTQNLAVFRRDINNFPKSASLRSTAPSTPLVPDGDMMM